MDHELESLEQFIKEARARFDSRHRLRESNQQANIKYPSETYFDDLDSSIKKNSAFVKKLKIFTESQKEQILGEIDRLNLTKFTSEIASSIIEAKFKLSDINAIVEICTKLNLIYRDFSKHLLDQYAKYFPPIKKRVQDPQAALLQATFLSPPGPASHSGNASTSVSNLSPSSLVHKSNNSGKNSTAEASPLNPSKMRVDIRLFAELIISGLFPLRDSLPILINLLSCLMFFDKNSYQNSSAILAFCRCCGDEFLGLVPARFLLLAERYGKELPKSNLLSMKRQEVLKNCIIEYHKSLLKHFNSIRDELSELVASSRKIYRSKGEVTKDLKESIEIKKLEYQKTLNVLNQLAEALCISPPDLQNLDLTNPDCQDDEVESDQPLLDSSPSKARNSSVWDDEGTRCFYEDLPDLKSIFPHLSPRINSTDQAKLNDSQVRSKSTEDDSVELTDDKRSLGGDSDSRGSTPTKANNEETIDELDDKTISSASSEESLINVNESNQVDSKFSPASPNQSNAKNKQPELFFTKLPNCVNRDMIDEAAVDFIKFFNTKFGRKKLIKTLVNVQRTRLDLLPFFARLIATIHPYVPTIGNEMVSILKQEFKNLFKKKDQINIESKVKNVRFIGELVKFNLYPKQEALICLKLLLSDFTHHHIEMTCNLLETCGRVLYNSAISNHQMRLLLEQMMRKKLLLTVDSKYITMIENAYYFTNPPDNVRQIVEEPPVHTYVRYLLCECLNRSTIDKVLQKIKKLDWGDKKLAKFVINCMTEAYNLKFYNIRYLAALLAALNKENSWISIAVIDGVVEDILLMMEVNELHFNQRRIPMIRYFGELYNYRLSDSSLVFKILYSLVTYGVHYPEPDQTLAQIPMSKLDPPENLFRIKLICDLLETCGQYLSNGQEKRKLDCYLLFFQRYYWCKKFIYMLHPFCMSKTRDQFPAAIEFLFNDTIYNLRPNFQSASSYSQALQLVQAFIDSLSNSSVV